VGSFKHISFLGQRLYLFPPSQSFLLIGCSQGKPCGNMISSVKDNAQTDLEIKMPKTYLSPSKPSCHQANPKPYFKLFYKIL
jgi:hypothetical protein